ncbi:MAG TPA: vitamin K epoxide reductase family protein [Actinomycetota bacterium]
MSRVARWVPPVSLSIAVAGIAVSTYLTIAHYAGPDVLACGTGDRVNCEVVTTSAQSTILGIPVALLGLAWFVAMAALCVPTAWRSEARSIHLVRLAATIAGIGFALWLIYAELFIIDAICLWCTVAHVLAFALFGIAAVASPALLIPDEGS